VISVNQPMSSSATNENLLFDLVVVGGGVVGLATCRFAALQGYKVACIEKEADLCHWASGSNSGIICTGVDAAEGSLERALIRDSIAQLRAFCREMNLPTRPSGSLVCRWPWDDDDDDDDDGNNDSAALRRVLMESHDAGDTHASFLTPDQVAVKEPHLNSACLGAVHIPGEVVVDPWYVGSTVRSNWDVLVNFDHSLTHLLGPLVTSFSIPGYNQFLMRSTHDKMAPKFTPNTNWIQRLHHLIH